MGTVGGCGGYGWRVRWVRLEVAVGTVGGCGGYGWRVRWVWWVGAAGSGIEGAVGIVRMRLCSRGCRGHRPDYSARLVSAERYA